MTKSSKRALISASTAALLIVSIFAVHPAPVTQSAAPAETPLSQLVVSEMVSAPPVNAPPMPSTVTLLKAAGSSTILGKPVSNVPDSNKAARTSAAKQIQISNFGGTLGATEGVADANCCYTTVPAGCSITITASPGIQVVDSGGNLTITATESGTITLTAKKAGYADATETMEVGCYKPRPKASVIAEATALIDMNSSSPMVAYNETILSSMNVAPTSADKTSSLSEEDQLILRTFVNGITAGCASDNDKAFAINDWVTHNVYYDFTSAYAEVKSGTMDVYNGKVTDCTGFSNLTKQLFILAGIPARISGGVALNEGWNSKTAYYPGWNHAWNEVYIDGTWQIIDTTWNTYNRYQDGVFDNSRGTSNEYYMPDIQTFSATHKITRYS